MSKSRSELIQILSGVVMQHQSVPESEAVEILDRSSTTELADQFYRAVRSGVLLPNGSMPSAAAPTHRQENPTVTAADVERARIEGEQQKARILAESEEKLIHAKSERFAAWEIHKLHMQHLQEPKRQAEAATQLIRDKATFEDAYQTFRSFGNTQANFSLTREVLGPGFSVYDIQNAISAGALQLTPPTPEEIQAWADQDEEQRREYLLTRSPLELRQIIRAQADQRRAEQQRREVEEADKARAARTVITFPPLPAEITAEKIKRASVDQLKQWIRRWSDKALTDRLRGLA